MTGPSCATAMRASGLAVGVVMTALPPGRMNGAAPERRLPSTARQAMTEVLLTLNWPGTRSAAATRW